MPLKIPFILIIYLSLNCFRFYIFRPNKISTIHSWESQRLFRSMLFIQLRMQFKSNSNLHPSKYKIIYIKKIHMNKFWNFPLSSEYAIASFQPELSSDTYTVEYSFNVFLKSKRIIQNITHTSIK